MAQDNERSSKKSKKQDQTDAEAVVEDVVVDSKKDRKKKKKERENKMEEQVDEVVPEQVVVDKKDKKKKKKKSKSEEDVAVPAASDVSSESEIMTDITPTSNQKKRKEAEVTGDDTEAPKKKKKTETELPVGANGVVEKLTATHGDLVVTMEPGLFKPFMTFPETGFSKQLLGVCRNFEKPTVIQSYCWPIAAANRDVVGIAATGSGKTIAFLLPALKHITEKARSKKKRVSALILSPTRELAMQIFDVCEEAGKTCDVSSVCIYGGVPKDFQRKALRAGVDIVVGTPGRVKDLIDEGVLQVNDASYLVLDEADRMLDFGFEKEIRAIISNMPAKTARQTLMFSATWPTSIQDMAFEYLNKPLKVTVGSDDLAANHNVTQIVEVMEEQRKLARLTQLLEKHLPTGKTQKVTGKPNRVLMFVLYKKEAERMERTLWQQGWHVVSIHGDKSQNLRTEALQKFKEGSVPLLIATDVAARGLDIPDVEVVINHTFPLTVEDYVHRIGRTGRAGKTGIAYTFFTPHEKSHSGELIQVLREAKQEVPEALMRFGTHVKPKKKKTNAFGIELPDTPMATMPKASHVVFDDDE